MKQVLRQILRLLGLFGINPIKGISAFRALPRYFRERRAFRKLSQPGMPKMGPAFPILHEYHETSGTASGHYFHMDLWAARKIFQAAPTRHLDIGSRIDGFIAHLLSFREVEVIDIRPLESELDGLSFVHADATKLDGIADNSVESLSCLHAAEHFGLGRYGDPIDPGAYRDLLTAMARVVRPGGKLYFAAPVGRERVEFNAHRVFDPTRIVRELAPLKLVDFSAVGDKGEFIKRSSPEALTSAYMACGLYEFEKVSA
jgi:SAM-dependent methyltransferase